MWFITPDSIFTLVLRNYLQQQLTDQYFKYLVLKTFVKDHRLELTPSSSQSSLWVLHSFQFCSRTYVGRRSCSSLQSFFLNTKIHVNESREVAPINKILSQKQLEVLTTSSHTDTSTATDQRFPSPPSYRNRGRVNGQQQMTTSKKLRQPEHFRTQLPFSDAHHAKAQSRTGHQIQLIHPAKVGALCHHHKQPLSCYVYSS